MKKLQIGCITAFFAIFLFIYAFIVFKEKNKLQNIYNRIIKKKIVVIEPNSSTVITLNKKFWIVPLVEYASNTNFFGMRIANEVFVFDKKCPSVFPPGKTVEIINLFSTKELKICIYYIKNQQVSKSNTSLIFDPFLEDLNTMISSGCISSLNSSSLSSST